MSRRAFQSIRVVALVAASAFLASSVSAAPVQPQKPPKGSHTTFCGTCSFHAIINPQLLPPHTYSSGTAASPGGWAMVNPQPLPPRVYRRETATFR